jgi:nicotinamide-nucleotide amidase
MKVSILSIGDEVVTGKTINTNASFISDILYSHGFEVINHLTVRDNKNEIFNALDFLVRNSQLIITSGGLGPTYDDLTMESIADYFGIPLRFNEEILNIIEGHFIKMNVSMTNNNKKQAFFPEGSKILFNKNGTASGAYFEAKDIKVACLPGPPRELNPMLIGELLPILKKNFNEVIEFIDISVVGMGESFIEEKISTIVDKGKIENVYIATYVSDGFTNVRIRSNSIVKIDEYKKLIIDILKNHVFSITGQSLEEVVFEKLHNKKLTISCAESCTGGMLLSSLVSIPGVSNVLKAGYVTYSNESKINDLNVNEATISKYGAVSKETVREMLDGLDKKCNSNVQVAISGIAGPSSDDTDKKVGLTYIGVKIEDKLIIKEFNFTGNRNMIRKRATINALNMIRLELL